MLGQGQLGTFQRLITEIGTIFSFLTIVPI